MTKIERIIYDNLSSEISQTDANVDSIFSGIIEEIQTNEAVAIEDNGLVFLVKPETKHVARMHIFGETKNLKQFLISAVNITKYVFDNANINKMYGMSADKRFVSAGKRTCWKQQGVLADSYLDENGIYKDQYIFGVSREELNEYLRKL
jgi:hypothetical protein